MAKDIKRGVFATLEIRIAIELFLRYYRYR